MTVTSNSLMKITAALIASGAKFNASMQDHICNILDFVHDGNGSGNVTPATDLIQQLTRKADKVAIVSWFTRHGGVKWYNAIEAKGKAKGKPEGFRKDVSQKDFKFNLEACKADNWYAEKEAAAVAAANGPRTTKFDLAKRVETLVNNLEEIMVDKVEGDVIPDFLVKGLRALHHEYQIYLKGQEAIAKAEAEKVETPVVSEIVKPVVAPAAKRRSSGNKERERLAREQEQVAA